MRYKLEIKSDVVWLAERFFYEKRMTESTFLFYLQNTNFKKDVLDQVFDEFITAQVKYKSLCEMILNNYNIKVTDFSNVLPNIYDNTITFESDQVILESVECLDAIFLNKFTVVFKDEKSN